MSKINTIKTYAEHKQYLHEICKLQLWYAWQYHRHHPQEEFNLILRDRIDIYRKTDINIETMNPEKTHFDDPRWVTIEQKLCELNGIYKGSADAASFETAAFAVVQPAIDARAERDFTERPYVLDYQCGSLKYDLPKEKHPGRVVFHIANAIAPYSIFDEPRYLPDCFLDLMDKSEAEHGADSLGTETWLNAYPKWVKIFPSLWEENMEGENHDVMWHFGFWGQFITARGTFNNYLGKQLRTTGEFPFWPRYSWCSFSALRKHFSK